jgi:hypothetical protein
VKVERNVTNKEKYVDESTERHMDVRNKTEEENTENNKSEKHIEHWSEILKKKRW